MQMEVSPADRLTQLAIERTALAVERAYAAWIRIGLGALACGLAVLFRRRNLARI